MTYYDALIAARDAAIEKHSPQAPGLAVALNIYRCWDLAGGPQVDDYAVVDNDLLFSGCPRCER